MTCPNCGGRMVEYQEMNGYYYLECENCGLREEDPAVNEYYNEKLRYR